MSSVTNNASSNLTIFFDGACHLCSREIEHYQRRSGNLPIKYVDISQPGFDPIAIGFDPLRVRKHLYVLDRERLFVGVEAFIRIWQVIPGYKWLARVISLPGISAISKVCYSIFARIRPLLPKRKSALQHCGESCSIK